MSHPDFCAGTAQSPIDLDSTKVMVMSPGEVMMVGYNVAQPAYIGNNGHTLGFGFRSGVTPYIHGGRLPKGDRLDFTIFNLNSPLRFDFLQMHWHWGSNSSQGSEHTLDGAEFPIEIHLVHVNSKYDLATALTQSDGLAVLGVFYEISAEDNPALEQILAVVDDVAMQQRMARRKGARATTTEADLPMSFMLKDVMPADTTDYYYYQGGLTTPTCNEVVLWTNFMSKATISEAQLAKFRMLTSSDGKTLNNNYRPPQPLGDRTIYATKVTCHLLSDTCWNPIQIHIPKELATGCPAKVDPPDFWVVD